MAVYEHTLDGLTAAAKALSALPDSAFAGVLDNQEIMTAIRTDIDGKRKQSNIRIGESKTSAFPYDGDRSLLYMAIAYYKARRDITPNRNIGAIRKAVSCFGQENSLSWIDSVCEAAGVSFTKSQAQTIKTEQEKDAEQQAGRDAVAEHLSGKRKSVKENPKPAALPEIQFQPDQAETGADAPEIGTAFLASGINFILYKPSEAYQMPERVAVIDKYFYADTISLLYGQAGSYKTWFALWEGVSLVIGKELCGMPINDPNHKVLYLSLEMTAKDIADRLSGMTKDLTEAERAKVDENFAIVSAENTQGMKANQDFLGALSILCKERDYDVIYLDSFADYVAGHDIRSENEMTAIIDNLRAFVMENHVSFRIIHHGTKPTQDTNGSMAGIHTIRDLVDNVYLIKANDQNEITVSSDMQQDRSAKSRFSEPTTIKLKFITDSGAYSFKRIQDTETKSYLEKLSELLTLIEENQGISAGELRDKLKNPKDLTKMIDGAIKAGSIILQQEKAGNGSPKKRYYTAEYFKGSEG